MSKSMVRLFTSGWVGSTALGLTAWLAAATASGQQSLVNEKLNDNGTRLEVISVFDPLPPSGYAPLRVVATNADDNRHEWSLNFTHTTQEYRRLNSQSSRVSLAVPALSTQTVSFLMPVVVPYGNGSGGSSGSSSLSILLSGSSDRTFSHHSNGFPSFPAIAISKTLSATAMSSLENLLENKLSSRSSYYGAKTFGCEFEPEEAPEDWLGFSGFDYVILADTDWPRLRPAARQALLHWARLGGILDFHTSSSHAAGLPPADDSFSLGKIRHQESWEQSGAMHSRVVNRYWNEDQRLNTLTEYHAAGLTSATWALPKALPTRSFNSWQVVAFLVVFGVLVGPVNLFVFAPSGRRHRLFLTTPLISFGASLFMGGLILVQDGLGGIGARIALVNLEPGEAMAYVTQKQISRTGVLFGSGFEIQQRASIEPLALSDSSRWVKLTNSYNSQPVALNQTGLAFSGNYFQSRAEQAQLLRAAIPTRARLELVAATAEGGAPSIVSALGTDVKTLFYADGEGKIWKLQSDLATGQKATLAASSSEELKKWWRTEYEALAVEPAEELPKSAKNRFFASASGAAPEWVQETLPSIRWQSQQVLITGTLTPP